MYDAITICGLGWGDEGKGSVTDFLARHFHSPLVVRYNGGSQAAHHVVLPAGDVHCFSQFGSGMLAGAATYISQYMLVDPFDMEREAEHLAETGIDGFATTVIDSCALVITPYHKAANRIREYQRGARRHGSCGRGLGECRSYHLTYGDDALFIGDLADANTVRHKLEKMAKRLIADLGPSTLRDCPDHAACFTADLVDIMARDYRRFWNRIMTERGLPRHILEDKEPVVLFEGAQGVLLDETHGVTPPHVTWTDTTFGNADRICLECGMVRPPYRLGVLRAYHTRHGAGPFPSEDVELTARLPDWHNGAGAWQGAFRVGHFDLELARFAIRVCGHIDGLALTCLDQIGQAGLGWKALVDGKTQTVARNEEAFVEWIEDSLNVPVVITSHGPTHRDKRHRRAIRPVESSLCLL